MSESNERPRNKLYEDRVAQAKIVRRIVFFLCDRINGSWCHRII